MAAYNEWELLVASEDIEPGDTLAVENEDGEQERMVFVRERGRGVVELRDKSGKVRAFSTQNLEEHDGYAFIIGKAD